MDQLNRIGLTREMRKRVRAFYNKVPPKLAIPYLSVKIKLFLKLSVVRQAYHRQRGFPSAVMKSTVLTGKEVLAGWCVE